MTELLAVFSTRKEGYGGRSISKSLSKRVWLGKNCESVPKKGSNRVYSLALTKRLFIPPPSLDIFAEPPPLGISLPGLFLRLFRAPPTSFLPSIPCRCRAVDQSLPSRSASLLLSPSDRGHCASTALPPRPATASIRPGTQRLHRALLVPLRPPSSQGHGASIQWRSQEFTAGYAEQI